MTQNALQLIWGCDPRRQLEVAWLHQLIGGADPVEELGGDQLSMERLCFGKPRLLVESGLLRLERAPSPALLMDQRLARQQRIKLLAACGAFTLVHLSDEEGLDGDELYSMLPPGTPIWRNFPYERFGKPSGMATAVAVQNFPIGPRAEFLGQPPPIAASARPLPWAFMGTIWGSGSRLQATALFLRALPQGFFYGGRNFATGLPIDRYRATLGQTVFALCPEGDRHLDTFRLYESLQMGCLPLVVDRANQARPLLGPGYPLPIFGSWHEALSYAQDRLLQPRGLDQLQRLVVAWWRSHCEQLATSLKRSCRLN